MPEYPTTTVMVTAKVKLQLDRLKLEFSNEDIKYSHNAVIKKALKKAGMWKEEGKQI